VSKFEFELQSRVFPTHWAGPPGRRFTTIRNRPSDAMFQLIGPVRIPLSTPAVPSGEGERGTT